MSFHVSLQLLFKSLLCLLSLVLVKIHPSLANPGLSCELPFLCGNIAAGYPFWGGERLKFCGHPSFQLHCQNDDTATMIISNVTYRVLNVNPEEKLLKIASQEYFQGLCPQKNITINSSLLDIANGFQTLKLIYGCPKFPGEFMTCNMNNDIINYMDGFIQFRSDISLVPDCNTSVLVPVSKSFISAAKRKKEDLENALKSGFEIKWKVLGCNESCISCGYDAVSNKEICYCKDGIIGNSSGCSDPSKGNKKLSTGAGIGIAVGSAGAVILGLGFFCCIRRRRKTAANIKSKDLKTPPSSTSGTTTTTTTTTTNSSQSNPSHPYTRTDLEKGSSYFGAQVFSCSELEEATDNFNPSKQLGDGGFGAVYLGALRDGRIVAVKRLYQNNFKRAEQFMNEIEILTRLQHKNLVKLYGCTSRQSRELLLVYEYIPNGTVADHLHNRQSNSCLLPWPVRLSIAIETAEALAYLHASDVIHRDVKTNNILLDNNFRVKVADFGLSRLFPTDVTHVSTAPQGTPGYVDPEYFQCYKLTDKSDVYSFGVVLIELISGLQAVDTNRHRYDINLSNMAVKKIQNHALNELVDQSLGFEKDYAVRNMVTSVAELAFRCLQQDREMRPTMKQVLEILRETKDSHLGTQKAEVVEIRMADDAVLLKKDSPTLSPDGSGTGTDKWAKIITI